jgi:hypothetical protein
MTRLAARILTLALVAGSTVPMLAHEGHNHKIMGTVTTAAADRVLVKDKSGKDVTIQVTKNTRIKAKPAMKVEDIKAGTRVVVTATMDKDKTLKAATIEVGAAPK